MEEASQRITYREISALVNEHYFQRAANLIGYVNYHLGYYDMSQVAVPLISFVVIDSSEVIVGFYGTSLFSSKSDVYLSIRDPLMVEFFRGYYEKNFHGVYLRKLSVW